MKTYKNLYHKIHTFENLYLAYRKARRGKRNRPAVAAFEIDSEPLLIQIQNDLKLISFKQYEYVCGLMVEVRRLLGGWQRSAIKAKCVTEG